MFNKSVTVAACWDDVETSFIYRVYSIVIVSMFVMDKGNIRFTFEKTTAMLTLEKDNNSTFEKNNTALGSKDK